MFWRLALWLASRRLSDPCKFRVCVAENKYFKLEIGRVSRKEGR